jgi:hypothetical protein
MADLRPEHSTCWLGGPTPATPTVCSTRHKQQCPRPIKMSIYFLYDALKKLRKVSAKLDPELYNRVMYLWRGMRNITT